MKSKLFYIALFASLIATAGIINRIPRNLNVVNITTSNITSSGTVTSSSGTAAYSVDGNLTTYCRLQGTFGTQYIQYDCGSGNSKHFDRVQIYNNGDNNNPSSITVKVSATGSSWTSVKTISLPDAAIWTDASFSLTGAVRYVRVYVNDTHSSDPDYQRIYELRFWGG